ncbi:hypothetical protein K443DRAFT_123386 [Laccaria amethystina LaAM-08-1]|uniref:Uncharacterized protein n=1 Tax=Laccaria amethystina LaAM-08-1 TaxID=1095629 RepID=A0A0C9XC65_9AGAR|nr:hypothetical protein K443DRAFT_123386 [Laccaria amethystina LaAM-08-1]
MTFVRAHDHPAMVAFAAQIEEHRGPTTISTIAPAWIDDEKDQTSNSVAAVEEDSKGCDADVEAAVLEPVLTKNAGESTPPLWKEWDSIGGEPCEVHQSRIKRKGELNSHWWLEFAPLGIQYKSIHHIDCLSQIVVVSWSMVLNVRIAEGVAVAAPDVEVPA